MNQRKMLRIILAVLIGVLCVTLTLHAQTEAVLLNPGFEPPFEPLPSDLGSVAQGWLTWSINDTQLPEYYPASDTENGVGEPQIRSGEDAQQYFSFFTPHDGGVYQVVDGVLPGVNVQFSVFAFVLSSNEMEPTSSSPDADMTVQVGIDPTGGTDGGSATIVWSEPVVTYDSYAQYTIEATAAGDIISVWVRSTVNTPLQYNIVYLDDAALFITSAQDEPTEEPSVEVTPEVTLEIVPPIATIEVTPEVTDEPVLEITPEVTDEPVIEPTPDVTEEPSVEVTPEVTLEIVPPIATIEVTPEITDEPIVEPTHAPTDEPTAEPTSTMEPPTATMTEEEAIIVVTPTFTPSPSPTLNTTLFPQSFTYVIQSGDTLLAIARRFGSTVEGIEIANQLAPGAIIFVGQTLIIPVQTLPETPTVTPEIIVPVETSAPIPTEAPATATPTAASQELGVVPTATPFIYIVQYGDTLSTIAARFGTTTRELARLNGIVNPNLVFAGQALRIGGAPGVTPTPRPPIVTLTPTRTPSPMPSPTPVVRVYVVQPGDTLYFISIRFNVPIRALIELNNIVNANRIFVGQVLILP